MTYRYPLLQRLRSWKNYGCNVGSVADLAAMKLLALAQRGSKKDLVDIHALSQKSISLRQMLRWYRAKFGVQSTTHVLYSLLYFDDAEGERMPAMLKKINWRTVKRQMRQWVDQGVTH